jgi:dipeptidyl-peptidase-4
MATTRKKLTLSDCFEKEIFKPKIVGLPQWMKDGKRLCYLFEPPGEKYRTVWMLDSETGKTQPIVNAKKVKIRKDREPGIDNFLWSPDETQILFCSQGPARISSPGAYSLYDVQTRKHRRLRTVGAGERNAKFSPDGSRLAFVRQDDLHVLNLPTGAERRLTRLAKPAVYVGRFGWVYEEELGLRDGWAWSPDGSMIAFYWVDERQVPEFAITDFAPQHPRYELQRYPKAGDPNPEVRIGVVPASGGKVRWIETEHEKDGYLCGMQWTPDGKLLIQRTPRLQNRIDVLLADPATGKCRRIVTDRDDCWVGPAGKLKLVARGKQFLWLSDRSGWRHIYVYSVKGRLARQLTSGRYEVTKIEAVDERTGLVYFTAARPTPMDRNLYAVPLKGGRPVRVTKGDGLHEVTMAEDGRRYLDVHSDLNTPPASRVMTANGHVVAEIVEPRIEALEGYGLQKWRLLQFRTSDGVTLNARMLRPPASARRKRHPAVIHTYGGPHSQVVMNRWSEDGLAQYLAQQGYVSFMCDGRGSGGRGSRFTKVVYLKLGKWEAHDQIEAARYLKQRRFIDPRRIAIWGWSYGGYLSSLAALLGGDTFKACVSVAPVTHYELYDTIYTERFMRTPNENPGGYRDGAPETHAEKLQCALLIVHGASDDNVHFQNAARLIEALQKAGKQFETMFYPGKKHGIEGMRLHIFTMFERFLRRSL